MKIITTKTIELVGGRIPEDVILILKVEVDSIYIFKSVCGLHELRVSKQHFQDRLNIDYMKLEGAMNDNEIKRGNYIIGSINKQTGDISFAKQPKIHTYQGAAISEAKRLATDFSQKKFVVVEVKAIARTVEVVVE